MDMFRHAAENSRNPLCYNGDILTLSQAKAIAAEFPKVQSIMIGRGLVADPGMFCPEGTTPDTLEAYLAQKAPAPLADLRQKPVRFDHVIPKEEMPRAVLDWLSR